MYRRILNEGKWWPTLRKDLHELILDWDPCLKFNIVRKSYYLMGFVKSWNSASRALKLHNPNWPRLKLKSTLRVAMNRYLMQKQNAMTGGDALK